MRALIGLAICVIETTSHHLLNQGFIAPVGRRGYLAPCSIESRTEMFGGPLSCRFLEYLPYRRRPGHLSQRVGDRAVIKDARCGVAHLLH